MYEPQETVTAVNGGRYLSRSDERRLLDSYASTLGGFRLRLTPSLPVGAGGRITRASVLEGALIVSLSPRSVSGVNRSAARCQHDLLGMIDAP